MINKIILICFIFIVSCKTIDTVKLIKDTGLVDTPIAITIKTFPFDTDIKGHLDSIIIKKKEKKELYKIINTIRKQKGFDENLFNFPKYAFIMKYNNIKDTLYSTYDFKYNFFIKNDLILIDNEGVIKKLLFKKHSVFLEKMPYDYEMEFYSND